MRRAFSGVEARILLVGGVGVSERGGLFMGPSMGRLVFLKYKSIAPVSSIPLYE